MSMPGTRVKLGRRLRRSKRLGLTVRVCVYGQDAIGERFREFTHMVSVNAHGGLLVLAAEVQRGQTLLIENRNTREEQEFRVIQLRRLAKGAADLM